MAEEFFRLGADRRFRALEAGAAAIGRVPALLEKDVYEVWALEAVFGSEIGKDLVFKGGTSLSKVHSAIRRFSEDIDLTYDIRAIAADLIGGRAEPMPATRSEEKRWTSEIRSRLEAWVAKTALPIVKAHAGKTGLPAEVSANGDKIVIAYEPVSAGSPYVTPFVKLEFGARSTGEPNDVHPVGCYLAEALPALQMPTVQAKVMKIERTFWEKATAVHVFCLQDRLKHDRLSRHWYDLAELREKGHSAVAIADREVADAVAAHKAVFYAAKDAARNAIDYAAATQGGLRLVPDGAAYAALELDYLAMIEAGMFLDDPPRFDELIDRCTALEKEINGAWKAKPQLSP